MISSPVASSNAEGAHRGRWRGAGLQWLRRYAATTPGVLVSIAVAAVVLCLVSGLVTSEELRSHTARRDVALQRSEPVAAAAQRLYGALSTADASAATAFLSGGVEPAAVRKQYQQSMADAGASLAATAAATTDPTTERVVAEITVDLPVYAGLVESARTNNRQGYPVGSAYLREASNLMQNSLLPNAAQLATQRYAVVRSDERSLSEPPWVAMVLLVLTFAGATMASAALARRTNRTFNTGVVVGTLATVLAIVWVLGATIAAKEAVDIGSGGPAARGANLGRALILAQQARTDETLALITRGDTTASEDDFTVKTAQLRARLESATASNSPMRQQLSLWMAGHRKQVEAYNAANYPAAVDQAIGTAPDSSARRFADLDDSLRAELAGSRTQLVHELNAGGGSWFGSAAGILVLMVIAASSVVAGLWPRLKEFL